MRILSPVLSGKRMRLIFLICAALPALRLIWELAAGDVVHEPAGYLIRRTGFLSMYLLCVGLAITPMTKQLKLSSASSLRKMSGLFAFFYAVVHVMSVIWLEHAFDLRQTWIHVARTPSNSLDALAFTLMIPLALTSTDASIRRLGGRAWRRLHSMVYLIVPVAASRFVFAAMSSGRWAEAIGFGTVVGGLLGIRLYWLLRKSSLQAQLPWSGFDVPHAKASALPHRENTALDQASAEGRSVPARTLPP